MSFVVVLYQTLLNNLLEYLRTRECHYVKNVELVIVKSEHLRSNLCRARKNVHKAILLCYFFKSMKGLESLLISIGRKIHAIISLLFNSLVLLFNEFKLEFRFNAFKEFPWIHSFKFEESTDVCNEFSKAWLIRNENIIISSPCKFNRLVLEKS